MDKSILKKIRVGYYSAVYFNRTKEILIQEGNFKKVTMQVFQKHDGSVLCGVREISDLIKKACGYYKKGKWIDKAGEVKVKSQPEGSIISAGKPVMHIEGPYAYFAHLESLYLGILARRTMVATQVRKAKEAARKKTLLFFADRFDYFLNQEGDGYAARTGGADFVCTAGMAKGFGREAAGTIPHALIAVSGGDTLRAASLFSRYFSKENLIALVDFNNDCVGTSLEVTRVLGRKLWGVRLDTSEKLVDLSLADEAGKAKDKMSFKGVNKYLVRKVRKELDKKGYNWVKIIVSGGFDSDKIRLFENENIPVDAYGIGSYFLHGENDFTADIVKVEGKHTAKKGRAYLPLGKKTVLL